MTRRAIERFEHTVKHLAVLRSNGDLVQFPDADGYEIDETTDNLTITSNTAEHRQIAMFRNREWEGIFYPGARRVIELAYGTDYDADGNVIESDSSL